MRKDDSHSDKSWDADEDGWKKEAPFLAALERTPVDDVPDGYFDALPDAMMARIRAMEEEAAPTTMPATVQSRWRTGGAPLAVAASLALILTIGVLWVRGPGDKVPFEDNRFTEAQLYTVSSEVILNELELSDLSEEELFEMLGKEAQAGLEGEFGELGQQNALDYLEELDLDVGDWEELDLDPEFLNDVML